MYLDISPPIRVDRVRTLCQEHFLKKMNLAVIDSNLAPLGY